MNTAGSAPGELDRRVAQLLVEQRLLAPEAVGPLFQQGFAARQQHGGSVLLGAALGVGVLSREAADWVLGCVYGQAPGHFSASGSWGAAPSSVAGSWAGAHASHPGSPPSSRPSAYGSQPAPSAYGSQPSPAPQAPTFAGQPSVRPGSFGSSAHPAPSDGQRTVAQDSRGTRATDLPGLDLGELGLAGPRYELGDQRSPTRWEALDRPIRRRVLLCLAPAGAGAQELASFWRHARILAQLDHPSIVKVHDLGEQEGRPYFSVDRAEGQTLLELMRGEDAPELPQLLRLFLSACAALEHAHARGLVHGALDPGSLRIGSHGRVWVAGWEGAVALPEAVPAVLRAAEGPPAARRTRERALAPELAQGDPPRVASDVYGLGVLLHWILFAQLPGQQPRSGGPARELAAVARKALAFSPEERYPRVADLREEVRRFIDGRSVEAVRDSALRAAIRLVRRYPFAAGIAGLAALLMLGGGAVTYGLVQARVAAARTQQQRAEEQVAQARVAEEEALRHREQAERRAAASTELRRFEGDLQAALAGGAGSPQRLAALSALAEGLGASEEPVAGLRAALLERLHRARGLLYLERARPPRPDLALADFSELVRLRPDDPEGQLLRYLAARRLPGATAEASERAALAALAERDGPYADLGRYAAHVEATEREAWRLAKRWPPQMIPWEGEQDPAYVALQRLARLRWDLSLAHELLGRYRSALCVPDLHRSVNVRLDGAETKPRRLWGPAFADFFKAIALDPLSCPPREVYLREHNAKFGAHPAWRWKGGYSIGNLARAARYARRAEPVLELVRQLQRLGRAAGTLPLLEDLLGRDWPVERREGPDLLEVARLYRARARLAAGRLPEPGLSELDLPPELRGQRRFLLAWEALARGRSEEGLAGLQAALQQPDPHNAFVLRDLLAALTDPRVDARAVGGALSQGLPAGGPARGAVEARFLLARAVLLARLGGDAQGDLARIHQGQQVGPYSSWPAMVWQLTRAESVANGAPAEPFAHCLALQTWAELNLDVDSREPGALRAQEIIVSRLRRLGRTEPAEAFAAIDPVGELLVRRQWVPPEAQRWRGEAR